MIVQDLPVGTPAYYPTWPKGSEPYVARVTIIGPESKYGYACQWFGRTKGASVQRKDLYPTWEEARQELMNRVRETIRKNEMYLKILSKLKHNV